MDVAYLQAFDQIVRERSFSRAAQVLEISQPAISGRIAALEALLGGALFVRGRRPLTLTERGEVFLPFARRALAILGEGAEAARLAGAGQRGRITVGAIESLTGGFLAAALARFHRTQPQVELFVRSGHTDQILQMLHDGIVGLGLLAWPQVNVEVVPLLRFREPLLLVAHAAHRLAHARGPLTLDQVAAEGPLLSVRWGPSARPLMARLAQGSASPLEVPIDTARQMVLDGEAAAFLTQTLVADDLAAGELVTLSVQGLPTLVRESALVRLPRNEPSSAATQLVAILGEEAARVGIAAPNPRCAASPSIAL